MGKCGLHPQHFHHRISITVVIFFISFLQYLLPAGFVLEGFKKEINEINFKE